MTSLAPKSRLTSRKTVPEIVRMPGLRQGLASGGRVAEREPAEQVPARVVVAAVEAVGGMPVSGAVDDLPEVDDLRVGRRRAGGARVPGRVVVDHLRVELSCRPAARVTRHVRHVGRVVVAQMARAGRGVRVPGRVDRRLRDRVLRRRVRPGPNARAVAGVVDVRRRIPLLAAEDGGVRVVAVDAPADDGRVLQLQRRLPDRRGVVARLELAPDVQADRAAGAAGRLRDRVGSLRPRGRASRRRRCSS